MDKGLEQPFVAYLNEKPVGCVSPRLDKETKSDVLDGGIHVLHEYRRQRIGTRLLLTTLKWLKENGMDSAWVTPNNPKSEEATKRAEAFYLAIAGTVEGESLLHSITSVPIFTTCFDKIKMDISFYLEFAKLKRSPILEIACGTERVLISIAEA